MAPLLALETISKRFGAVVVADGIDLALNEGEALGIIGPNGAGKTTLFGIATGTLAPDSGRVLFAGEDITRFLQNAVAGKGLARSFQIPQPFSGMTVFENVVVAAAFGSNERENAVYDRCAELLERCGLADKGKQACRRAHIARSQTARIGARAGNEDRAFCSLTRSQAASLSTNAQC